MKKAVLFQPIGMNDAQLAVYQQRMENQYGLIKKNLQKRRLDQHMVTPNYDVMPKSRPRPAKLPPRAPEQLPEALDKAPETPAAPPTPELPAAPAAIATDIRVIWNNLEAAEPDPIGGRYKLLKTLGKGNFGVVKLAKDLVTGEQVAVKMIKKPKNKFVQNRIYREVNIMNIKLDHPNIVKLFEVIESESQIYLIMEYCSGGDLDHYIYSKRYHGEKDAKIIFRQIVAAVQYCHENNIAHRDLKLENILVHENNTIKITDFGLSNIFSPGKKLTTFCGTPSYAAPEVLGRKSYVGTEVDIWSLGVILYQMVTLELPFHGNTFKEIYDDAKRGRYPSPCYISHECRQLIKQLLIVRPGKRLTMQKIIQSRWFTEDTSVEESGSTSSDTVPWWTGVRTFFQRCFCRCC